MFRRDNPLRRHIQASVPVPPKSRRHRLPSFSGSCCGTTRCRSTLAPSRRSSAWSVIRHCRACSSPPMWPRSRGSRRGSLETAAAAEERPALHPAVREVVRYPTADFIGHMIAGVVKLRFAACRPVGIKARCRGRVLAQRPAPARDRASNQNSASGQCGWKKKNWPGDMRPDQRQASKFVRTAGLTQAQSPGKRPGRHLPCVHLQRLIRDSIGFSQDLDRNPRNHVDVSFDDPDGTWGTRVAQARKASGWRVIDFSHDRWTRWMRRRPIVVPQASKVAGQWRRR